MSANVVRLPVRPKPRAVPTNEEKLAQLAKATPGQLVELFLYYRGEKEKAKEAAAKADAKLDILQVALQQKMQQLGQDGFRAKGRTVYPYVLTTARVIDPKEFREFVLQDPGTNLDLIELKASRQGIEAWMLSHPKLDRKGRDVTVPPPGSELVQHHKIGVQTHD